MFSRYTLPKNVDKYYKSLNNFKEKWNYKKQNTLKYTKKYIPLLGFDVIKGSDNNVIKKETKPQIFGFNLRQFQQILDKSKLNKIRNFKLNDKLVLSTAGVVTVTDPSQLIKDPIPEPPLVPVQEVAETIKAGEQSFEALGLGGWSPVGLIQNCLEFLNVTLDIPWWGAIAIGTVCVRIIVFPLVVIAQRNGAKMNNYMPQLQVLQLKMTEARQTGNQLEAARYAQEMAAFMKEKQLNPLKNLLAPLAQMPVFISFFIALRQMANCPVQSMQTGGLFWFTDLTLPDQYFALPIITSITMWATIELGTDTGKLTSPNMQMMKYVLRAMPIVILPFTINFPGAILCYWVCTNFISLGQVGLLRLPVVRDFFKIEPMISHNPENLPIKSKGFVAGVQESWTNMKITNEVEGRRRYDEMRFQRAGKGPLVKTYKFDPTKQNQPAYSTKKSS